MPKWVKAKRFSVFTPTAYAGNQAWVVLDAEGLPDRSMRGLANSLNPACDTAFVLPESTSEADIYLRFFTGSTEINFSGHAAIATYFALSDETVLPLKEPDIAIKQRTKAGIQLVDLRVTGNKITRATMCLAKPDYLDIDINLVPVAKFLGIMPDELAAMNLPLEVISTGYYDLIIPIKSLIAIKDIVPNFSLIDSFCSRLGIHGVIIFCMETFEHGDTAFMRHFAPSLGINEEPISGASAGALGCYLLRQKLVEANNFSRIIIEQGYLQGRQGKVYVHLESTREQILRVKVGGNAVLTFTGYMLIP
ncbi:MAG: PhzF family phenazine biosynthesis protein [candidate division WOR-3 bacterium]|nr:MAG: PhzF family phenazine biosynthesis protein [candidate division WOR-3 bacterium]